MQSLENRKLHGNPCFVTLLFDTVSYSIMTVVIFVSLYFEWSLCEQSLS